MKNNKKPYMKIDEFEREYESRERMEKERRRSKAQSALGWALAVAIAVLVAVMIRAFVFEIILVSGPSMQPTLYTDERLAVEKVSRYAGLPERGDIVIVHYSDGTNNNYVKRVIGLPGEVVEVKDSIVYIDGQPLAEDYIDDRPYVDMGAVKVPEDEIFVMGDNRADSMDSRMIGPIRHDQIVGHAMAVLYPFSAMRWLS